MIFGLLLSAIIFCVLTIGVVLLPMMLLRAERTRIWGVAYMSLYVGVYLVLTLKGQYVAHNNFKENFGGAGVGEGTRAPLSHCRCFGRRHRSLPAPRAYPRAARGLGRTPRALGAAQARHRPAATGVRRSQHSGHHGRGASMAACAHK